MAAAAAARSDHSDDDEDVVLVGGDSDNDDGTDANNGLVCMVLSSGNAKHNHTTHLVVLTDRQINGRQRNERTRCPRVHEICTAAELLTVQNA